MTVKHRLPFEPVDKLIRVRHPDPDGDRQAQTVSKGNKLNAAVWLADVLGVDRRRILAWRVNGVQFFDADVIATRLGLHPVELWREWEWIDPDTQQMPVWRQLRAAALAESLALRQEVRRVTAA